MSSKSRTTITNLLLMGLVTHYSTQICRMIWHSYALSNDTLGALPTNVTFVLSIACPVAAGCVQSIQEKKLREKDKAAGTALYPPSLSEFASEFLRRWRKGELKGSSNPIRVIKEARNSYTEFAREKDEWHVRKASNVLAEATMTSSRASSNMDVDAEENRSVSFRTSANLDAVHQSQSPTVASFVMRQDSELVSGDDKSSAIMTSSSVTTNRQMSIVGPSSPLKQPRSPGSPGAILTPEHRPSHV